MSANGSGPQADERVDVQAFKNVLAHWASGVTIVTAQADGVVHGMTVSSFSSLSIDPPLVLVCAFRGSRTRELIGRSGRFAINLLTEGQAALATRFAGRRPADESPLEGVAWTAGRGGVPLLPGAAGVLECTVAATHEEGTHTILIGRVETAVVDPATRPLVYWERDFRRLELADSGDGTTSSTRSST
jgi:flavin reductase (DIM6/NTAB) family NADH-FMN oxidoreductase RutF